MREPAPRQARRARRLLAELGLSRLADEDMARMSYGEYRKILVARALPGGALAPPRAGGATGVGGAGSPVIPLEAPPQFSEPLFRGKLRAAPLRPARAVREIT